MNITEQTWSGNWKVRILSRITAAGFASLADFLAAHPGKPYVELARQLGEDVAALQLESLQFGQHGEAELRKAAKDSLARDLRDYLKEGWRQGAKRDFSTSSAYARWATRLEQKQALLKNYADLVWDALEELHPPAGWLPPKTFCRWRAVPA